MMSRKHTIVNFVDMGKAQDFRLTQCGCGNLARRHYELIPICEQKMMRIDEPYVADVICEKCFNNWYKS